MTIRRIINAPLRFFRYLTEPSAALKVQREKMSADEREQRRIDSLKRNGLFLAFVNFRPPPAQNRSAKAAYDHRSRQAL